MEKLSFEIKTRPLMYLDQIDEVAVDDNFKVIIRDDTSKVLSIMKKSYCELYNREFEKIVKEIVDISGFELNNFTEFKEGRIVLANLRNTKGDVMLFKKKIEDYLILGSSHDGSYPFFIGTAMNNIWCQNQFSRISRITKIRHTSTSADKRKELAGLIDLYMNQRELVYENFKKFQKVCIPEELRRETLARVLDIKEEDMLAKKVSTRKLMQLERLHDAFRVESGEYGETAYALFNAVTRYTTHTLNSKDKVFGNFHGVPGWLNDKAYKIAGELVEGAN